MTVTPQQERDALELASIHLPPRRPRAASAEPAKWHIVHCIGSSDQHALMWLKRLKIEAYYPHLREMVQVMRRKLSRKQRALGIPIMRKRIIPLLPRYIFVRFNAGATAWHDEFAMAGIAGLVAARGEDSAPMPIEVGDAMIEGIRAREVDGAIPGATPLWELLSIGDRVRITAGPFAELKGNVDAIRQQPSDQFDSGTRIRVFIDLFGQATPLDLDVDQIEKA